MGQNLRRARGRVRIGVFVAALVLAGCSDTPFKGSGADRKSYKAHYLAARSALEGGDYTKAVDGYGNLVGQSGPMTARVRIEYAHALLRAGRFAQAANEARIAAIELTGLAKHSALSIEATAKHELAMQMMGQGKYDEEVHELLVEARETFDTIAAALPKLDPKGGLQRRHTAALKAEGELKQTLGL